MAQQKDKTGSAPHRAPENDTERKQTTRDPGPDVSPAPSLKREKGHSETDITGHTEGGHRSEERKGSGAERNGGK